MTDSTTILPGQHYIGYAYPSSPNACALKQGQRGCFYVRTPAEMTAHATYCGCVEHVAGLGTEPNRWSLDHPERDQSTRHGLPPIVNAE